MEADNNKGSVNIVIQAENREIRLEMSREHESWIDQLKNGREPKEYKTRKTLDNVSIYRVPPTIKRSKPEAYDPLVVFLGPFHGKKEQEMTVMDEYKLQAVDRTLKRISRPTTREGLVAEVKELEGRIRECYEDSAAEFDGDVLAWIMTMDACFILEFLRMDLPDSSLVFCSKRVENVKRREILTDILKMENQIPLLILTKMIELEMKDPVAFLAECLNECGCSYFRGFPFKGSESSENNIQLLKTHIKEGAFHLLDLARRVISHVLSEPNQNRGADHSTDQSWSCRPRQGDSKVDTSMIPSAKKLLKSGIKLELDKEGGVHFHRRFGFFPSSKLYLPRIRIYDNTEIILRNLIALEECQRKKSGCSGKRAISRHVLMMNRLIDNREDVELFREAKIIKNFLGSDKQVAIMFNALCIEITEDDEFKDILKDVNEHYNSKLKMWMSELRKEHCSSPWYVISLLAAVILLVLTLLQTIYTMESYFAS